MRYRVKYEYFNRALLSERKREEREFRIGVDIMSSVEM